MLAHITEALVKSELLRIVELLELGQLKLRILVDLIDGNLKLILFLLKLVFEFPDFVLKSITSRLYGPFVLRVLLLG